MHRAKITRRRLLTGLGLVGAATATGALVRPLERLSVEGLRAAELSRDYMPQVSVHSTVPQPDNFIVILCDTLRYDHLGCHGNTWIQTPNIDAFAAQALVFDRAYAAGFPTLPNRCELLTGRYTYPYLSWEEIGPSEVVLPQMLNAAGYITGMIFDTPHIKGEGRTLERQFASWEWVRGQEDDRYRATPRAPILPADPAKFRHGDTVMKQYLRNVAEWQGEDDTFIARDVQAAIQWLRRTAGQGQFFLYIDAFDPHEPWSPPRTYVDLYDRGYTGQEVIYPSYAPPAYLTAAELRHVRALYAAEVTLVDHWLGHLFAELAALNLWQNTAVILVSDHGFLLGEHNAMGKSWDEPGHYECWPLYEELTHIPLMMRLPGVPPRRTNALAQPADLMPTILQLAGADDPGTMQGVSLAPVIADLDGSAQARAHQVVVTSRVLATDASARPRATVTDGAWTLLCGPAGAPAELYYLPTDPQQAQNVLAQNCAIARNLHGQMIAFWESIGVAERYLGLYRTAPC